MWALPAAVALIVAGGAAQAESAHENEPGLQTCFRAAHAAIAVCSEQSNNPEQRVDCLTTARADQLECINQALSAAGNVPQPDWVVSETTSPVDYSPLVSAIIHSTSGENDGPNSFAVRCRAQRTEVSLGTNGAWGVPRGNVLQVDYQIDDRPSIRQQWILAADGKTATYKDDAVELMRSIPEGAALKVTIADKDNVRREATFRLAGFSAVRQKVAAACQWTPAPARTSSDGR
jgi:hypothetical protein